MNAKRIFVFALLACAIFAVQAKAQGQQAAETEQAQESRKSSGLFPKDVEGLEAMAQTAIDEQNGLRLLQTTILLRRQQPYDPDHMVNMVRAYAMMGRPTSAYNYMLQMQQQGLTYDFNQLDETSEMRDTEVYTYVNDLLIRAGEAAGEAEPAFELDRDHPWPTALAWDPSREKFLVGTAGDGALLAVAENGKSKKLFDADDIEGLWGIMDIEVDAENDRLWLSTAAVPAFENYSKEIAGQGALLEFELDSLDFVGRYPVMHEEGPVAVGAIGLHPNGDVYLADREKAVVYRRKNGSDRAARFVADAELNGFRDMAISSDGARLYLADSDKGVLVIDPQNETAAMLEGPETLNLGGIEGLFQVGSELIIVQSGIEPQRIMALQLDPSGGMVQEVRPMAIAQEWFDGPSLGTIRDDAVYYFADARFPGAAESPSEVTVLRTALDAGQDIVNPDMRKFEEETLSKARDHQ